MTWAAHGNTPSNGGRRRTTGASSFPPHIVSMQNSLAGSAASPSLSSLPASAAAATAVIKGMGDRGIFLPFSASPRFRANSMAAAPSVAAAGSQPGFGLNLNSPFLGAMPSPKLAMAEGRARPATGASAAQQQHRRKSSDTGSLDWNALLQAESGGAAMEEMTLAAAADEANGGTKAAKGDTAQQQQQQQQQTAASTASQDFYAQQNFKAKRDVLSALLNGTRDVLGDLLRFATEDRIRHPLHSADPPPYDNPAAPTLSVLVDAKVEAAEAMPAKLFAGTLADLEAMHERLLDPSSKVLVTGDINAGKSTLINSLLQRDILWTDQQPSTQTFTEILSAETNNGGVEEVHAVHVAGASGSAPASGSAAYSTQDPASYTRFDLEHLPAITGFPRLRAYCNDESASRLLSNGVVDLQLIDSPGLNRHSTHTTAIFARQKLIDAVVFVVNAENHFTQSATEFLTSTSKEKPLLFVVVNKFDAIRDQQRCQREILAQLRSISPLTYEHADELVHFVSARLGGESFDSLQSQLKGFLLERRSFSKLAPTRLLLENVLSDLVTVCAHNALEARREMRGAAAEAQRAAPELLRLREEKQRITDSLEYIERDSLAQYGNFLAKRWAAASLLGDAFARDSWQLEWRGLLGAREYAENVAQLGHQLIACRLDETLAEASKCVQLSVASMHTLVASFGGSDSASAKPPLAEGEEAEAERQRLLRETHAGARAVLARIEVVGVSFRDVVPLPGWKVLAAVGAATAAGFSTGTFRWLKDAKTWAQRQVHGRYCVDDADDYKWIIGGASILSIGWLTYRLATLRASVHARMLGKARRAYAPLLPAIAQELEALPRPPLRESLYAAQNSFVRLLDERQREVDRAEATHVRASRGAQWFAQRQEAARSILHSLRNVEI